MKGFILTTVLVFSFQGEAHARVPTLESIEQLVAVLRESPTGKRLLDQARKLGAGAPHEWIRLGVVSKTDAILTRTLDPMTGKETLERQLMIQVRSTQDVFEASLNLAHELVHATESQPIDPYDLKLSLGQYLRAAIEGRGGEVDAFKTECLVGIELEQRFGWVSDRCSRYRESGTRALNLKRMRLDFYRVGQALKPLLERLGSEVRLFPELSLEEPLLYSSTGQAPYPVALAQEFETLNRTACRNSKHRLESLNRTLASASNAVRTRTLEFLSQRCSHNVREE